MAAADHKAWLQRRLPSRDSWSAATFHKEYADGDFAAAAQEEDRYRLQRGAALGHCVDRQFDWRVCFCVAHRKFGHFQSRNPRHVFENRAHVDAAGFLDDCHSRCSFRVVDRADGLAVAVRRVGQALGHHYFGLRSGHRAVAARRRRNR